VEVTHGGTNRVTANDGRVFEVRSLILEDLKETVDGKELVRKGPTIALIISQEQTDSNGVSRLSQAVNLGAAPGQTVGASDGIMSVRITPRIKQ
jgi:hypothetical protein